MKIEVYEKVPREDLIIRLKLYDRGYGVVLGVVDRDGEPIPAGNLLTIHDDGSLELHHAINNKLGFKLDGLGRLNVE